MLGTQKRALITVFLQMRFFVTAFLLAFKTGKTMSRYLNLFVVGSGVESYGSLILKNKGENQQQ